MSSFPSDARLPPCGYFTMFGFRVLRLNCEAKGLPLNGKFGAGVVPKRNNMYLNARSENVKGVLDLHLNIVVKFQY